MAIKVVRRSEEFNVRLVEVTVTGPDLNEQLDLPPAGMSDEIAIPFKPRKDEKLELSFQVSFSATGSKKESLKVKAFVANLKAIDLHHEDNTSLVIRLDHQPPPEVPRTEQCTVMCAASGEKKTGEHPCVTCSAGDVTVRLCC